MEEAAKDAFADVCKHTQTAEDDGPSDSGLYLYVYESGNWIIDNPQYLGDHNYIAQADAEVAYANPEALAAALAETVEDAEDRDEDLEPSEDDWCTSDHATFYEMRELHGGGLAPGKLVFSISKDCTEEQMWETLVAKMKEESFFPNVWYIDDHGGVSLLQPPDALKASV